MFPFLVHCVIPEYIYWILQTACQVRYHDYILCLSESYPHVYQSLFVCLFCCFTSTVNI